MTSAGAKPILVNMFCKAPREKLFSQRGFDSRSSRCSLFEMTSKTAQGSGRAVFPPSPEAPV